MLPGTIQIVHVFNLIFMISFTLLGLFLPHVCWNVNILNSVQNSVLNTVGSLLGWWRHKTVEDV